MGTAGPSGDSPWAIGCSLGIQASRGLEEAEAGTLPGATSAFGLGEGWVGLHFPAGAEFTLQPGS